MFNKLTGNNNSLIKTGGVELQPKKTNAPVKTTSTGATATVLENSKNKTIITTKSTAKSDQQSYLIKKIKTAQKVENKNSDDVGSIGIANDRPVIIMSTNFQSIFDQFSNYTNAGNYYSKQFGVRDLRQKLIEAVFDDVSNLGLDDYFEVLRSEFKKGFDRTNENVISLFEIIDKFISTKEILDIKNSIYDKAGDPIKFLEGRYSKNITEINNSFTSTKLWTMLFYEFKTIVEGMSFLKYEAGTLDDDPFSNNFSVDNNLKLEKKSSIEAIKINDSITTLVNNNTIEDTNAKFTEAFNSINEIIPNNSSLDERKVPIYVCFLRKHQKFVNAINNQSFIEFLSKNYDITINNSSNISNVFEKIVGNIPKDIFDKPKNSANSLISILNQGPDNAKILPFEVDYITAKDDVYTPGGVYYFDNILSSNTIDITNINSFAQNIKQVYVLLKRVIDEIRLITNNQDEDSAWSLYNLLINSFFTYTPGDTFLPLQDEYLNDPFMTLLESSREDMKAKAYLAQYVLYIMKNKQNMAKSTLDSMLTFMYQKFNSLISSNISSPEMDTKVEEIKFAQKIISFASNPAAAAGFNETSPLGKEFLIQIDDNGQVLISTFYQGGFEEFKLTDYIKFLQEYVNKLSKEIEEYSTKWWENNSNPEDSHYWLDGSYFYNAINELMSGESQNSPLGTKFIQVISDLMSQFTDNKFSGGISDSKVFAIIFDLVFDVITKSFVIVGQELYYENPFIKKYSVSEVDIKKDVLKFFDDVKIKVKFNDNFSKNLNHQFSTQIKIGTEENTRIEATKITLNVMQELNTRLMDIANYMNSNKVQQLISDLKFLNDISSDTGINKTATDAGSGKYMVVKSKNQAFSMGSSQTNIFNSPAAGTNFATNQLSQGLPVGAGTLQFGKSYEYNKNAVGASVDSMLVYENNLEKLNSIKEIFNKIQISNIASTFLDIKSVLDNNPNIKAGSEIEPLDDSSPRSKFKKVFESTFKNGEHINTQDSDVSRKKILSIGIPKGFSSNLKYNINFNGNSIKYKTKDLKQNDIIEIKVYKIDVLTPEIIYKPVSFLFELSRFVVKDESKFPTDYNDFATMIAKFPTRNFNNITKSELEKIYYLADFDASYSFLKGSQLKELYKNHVLSYMYEMYIKLLTGVSLSEKDFAIFDPIRYVSVETINKFFNSYKTVENKTENLENVDATLDEWSRKLTPLSNGVAMMKNIFNPRKFERIFNVLVDPYSFEIDYKKTTSTSQGTDALKYQQSIGDIITKSVLADGTDPDKKVTVYVQRPRNKNEVVMERYFVQINTTNIEVY